MTQVEGSWASTFLWGLPLFVLALAATTYGGDSPQASLALSTVLLILGSLAVLVGPRRISPIALLGIAGFAGLLALARWNGWLATGAHEYAVLAACGALIFIAFSGASTPERARRLWQAALILGGALSIAAFIDFTLSPELNFGRERPYALGRLSAPFLSANTAATFYGVIALMALAEIARTVRRAQTADLRDWIDTLARGLSIPMIILMFALSNVVLTASRGGLAALIIALLVLVLWEGVTRRGRRFGMRSWVLGLAATLIGGLGIYLLSGDALFSRLGGLGEDESRLILIESYWRAVQLDPLFGHGLGGFQAVNAQAGNIETNDFLLDQGAAHNLYLQWLLQTGLVGTLAAGALILVGIVQLLQGVGERRRNLSRMRAVITILLFVALHGLVDYAMEIPLFTWFIAWLFGLGLAMARPGSTS